MLRYKSGKLYRVLFRSLGIFVDGNFCLDLYKKMLLVRALESKLEIIFKHNKTQWFIYSVLGQEACGVGVASALTHKEQLLMPLNYRALGYVIGRGFDINHYLKEVLFRTQENESAIFLPKHTLPYSLSLGANFSIGIGAAIANRNLMNDKVCVCVFGDGAATRGTFYSSLNLSALWRLPILWICENNNYAVSTPMEKFNASGDIAIYPKAFGIKTYPVNGNNVADIYITTNIALEYIRTERKPAFIKLDTYRMGPHIIGDRDDYRPLEEKSRWSARDPIRAFRKKLLGYRILNHAKEVSILESIEQEICAIDVWK